MSPVARLRAVLVHPDRLAAFVVLLVIALWGLAAARWHPLPQTDSLEQIIFAQHWQLAYAKHPPLPTWILIAAASVVGRSVGLTFVLGALCSAVALAILYLWAKPLVGAPRAALATLLCSLIVYYNAMTSFYNHNTVQLPFTIATIALFHTALRRRRWRDWLAFGAVAGLTLTVKLTALLVLASLALYVFYLAARRYPLPLRLWLQMTLAGLVALAVAFVPLYALYGGNAAAGEYVSEAMVTSAGLGARLKTVSNFLGSVASCVLPAALVFAAVNRRAVPAHTAAAHALAARVPLLPFLAIVGFAPLLLTLAVALVTGANLLSPWGTSLVTLFALWLVAASRWRTGATRRMLWHALLAAVVLHTALLTTLFVNNGRLPNLGKRVVHGPLVTPQLSDAVRRAWQALSSAPLPPVVGNIRTAAPLALGFGGTPLAVDGNRVDFDRVVPPGERARCGVIFVLGPTDVSRRTPPPAGTVLDRFDAGAWALIAKGQYVVIEAPSTAGATYAYLMAYQLPDPALAPTCR